MSNEELFAAIHKSKKKLNIKLNENDNENLSPYGSMNSLVKTPEKMAGTRHSWSPESQKVSLEVIANTENHRHEDKLYLQFLMRNCFLVND